MDNMIKISELQKAFSIANDDVFVVNQKHRKTKVLETRYTTAEDITKYLADALEALMNKFVPVGSIKMYAGDITQYDKLNGWLLCNGQYVSRVKYKKLYEVIRGLYGPVNAETFPLPNFVGKIPLGYCGINNEPITLGEPTAEVNLADTGGEYKHQLTVDELAAHKHADAGHKHKSFESYLMPYQRRFDWDEDFPSASPWDIMKEIKKIQDGTRNPAYDLDTTSSKADIQNTGGNMPHNNIQPYLAVNYIIKY
jgi:microcystin-dependent protein